MFSGTQIECWPVDYVACSGLSQLSELFPKPQSLQIVLIFASTRQVWKAFAANTHTCSKSILGSRRVFHWVTQSFPQGDPIIFLDHPISATRAWHTPVATPLPSADGYTSRSGEPWQARLDVSSGIVQLPGFNTNKIRKYFTSIFQYVQESCSRLEFVDPEFLSCSQEEADAYRPVAPHVLRCAVFDLQFSSGPVLFPVRRVSISSPTENFHPACGG